jgi:ATP-binding cassette, subfamily B, bacterial
MVGIDTDGDEPASVVAAAPGIGVRAAWRRLWPYARPYRTGIAAGLVLIALIPAIQTAEIWLFKVVVDEVFTPRDLEPIAWIAAAYVGLNLLSGLVSFGDEYIATSIAERSLLALRRDLFRKTIDMPPHVLDRRPLGDLVTRFTSDVSAVETLLVSGASEGIAAVVNGLALCAIHHLAFDRNLLGIDPTGVVHIADRLLREIDGPMLKTGLQGFHGAPIARPRRPEDRPDPARLETRFERFLQAAA